MSKDDEALEAMRHLLKTWKSGMAMVAFAVLAGAGLAAIVSGIWMFMVGYYCTLVYLTGVVIGFGLEGAVDMLIRTAASFGIWSGIAGGSMLAFAGLDRLGERPKG